jgi:hypothetical protein
MKRLLDYEPPRRLGRVAFFVFGMVAGVLLNGVGVSSSRQPEPAKAETSEYYRVERQMETFGDPAALQELLDQRVKEGWLLQALDHERLVFRRASRAAQRTQRPPQE